ncbi:hypothetical protein CLV60_105405 [Dyadobacter jiangsuensis]|uniref:Uncharacterized protein n=1 Tax=Dyadobacter jiangsuensis TaxID=1591085 RepID=A0A2P8G6F2_9BACT|nr:hypothetical protein CLV60_105405 [Dyadobacter jiangsuensis]
MSDAERKELAEEDELLKKLLNLYHEYRQDISMTDENWHNTLMLY